jgi:hypothetical protein
MKNPGVVIPDAMAAIRALNEAIKRRIELHLAVPGNVIVARSPSSIRIADCLQQPGRPSPGFALAGS